MATTAAHNAETGTSQPARLIRLPEVVKRSGLSRASVYRAAAARTFPQPRRFGRTALWVEAEVVDWIERRVAEPGKYDAASGKE